MEPLSPRLERALERLDARIDWERRDRGAMRADLAPMADLVRLLGDPQEAWRVVHVGGTKGKGSVCALVASALGGAGQRVGLYASPHVERVTERVVVDGRPAPDDLLAQGLEGALGALESAEAHRSPGAAATWFDLMTAAAFLVFREAGVGWAVVEVGLGGRLDSTNVVRPEVCVITNVDLEHTAVLGNTRRAIATEKAGILKAGAHFVCGVRPDPGRGPAQDAGSVLVARARGLNLPLTHPAPAPTLEGRNLALARAVLDALGEREPPDRGWGGLSPALLDDPEVRARARLPGRLERTRLGSVPVVLDGAHVPSSLESVLADLSADPALAGPCVPVLCLGREKDAEGFLKALRGRVDRVHCTSVASGLHLAPDELAARAARLGLRARTSEPAGDAVIRAAAEAGNGGWVLVTGSLYLVGAVRGGLVTP